MPKPERPLHYGYRLPPRRVKTDMQQIDLLLKKSEIIQALQRGLEVIAVGDSKNPQEDARQALIESGQWLPEGVGYTLPVPPPKENPSD